MECRKEKDNYLNDSGLDFEGESSLEESDSILTARVSALNYP